MKQTRIAAIPGDGTGREVIAEGIHGMALWDVSFYAALRGPPG